MGTDQMNDGPSGPVGRTVNIMPAGATTARAMSREELEQLRQRLLDDVGMTYQELRARANAFALQADQRSAYETIRSIDFLLGK